MRRDAERYLRAAFLAAVTLPPAEILERLRPRPEDYEAVFGAHAAAARAYYEPIWAGLELGEIGPKPGQTEVTVYAAEARELASGSGEGAEFPGGMRSVADRFAPDQIFVHYRFHAPGASVGFTITGMVQTADGRLVLFPKPWRALEASEPA